MLQLLNNIPNSQARQQELHHRLEHLERFDRVQLLCLALDDPYPPLRHDVSEALQQELDEDLITFLESLVAGESLDESLLQQLTIPADLVPTSLRARVAACVALEASSRPTTTIPVIARILAEGEPDLRYQALIALHHLTNRTEDLRGPVERALLEDQDAEIVVVASQIAISRKWADALPLLVLARTRLNGEDRKQLTFSIAELIHETSATIEELDRDTRAELIDECVQSLRNEPLTAAATRALGHFEALEAVPALEKVTAGWFVHPILKVDAAVALLRLNQPSGESYIGKALEMRRKDAQGYALRIVGEYRLAQFFEHLCSVATSDTYHADTAVLALLDFGTPEAIALVEELRNAHPDPDVRTLAAEGLEKNALPHLLDPPGVDGSVLLSQQEFTPRHR